MKRPIYDSLETPLNPIVMCDYWNYLKTIGVRKGSVPTRSYMQHRNQTGYTRIRQTKANIIIEWREG